MKIVAGLGSVDDYIEYVKAGADEVFVGFIPREWADKYGLSTPLNRREVCYYNVQIGAYSDLEILAGLVEKYGVPATIALNGLHYQPDQFKDIADIILRCKDIGFRSFIIADLALLVYLHRENISDDLDIHVSGEMGEINSLFLNELTRLDINRLIFHRKVTVNNMSSIISSQPSLDYEAFLLNENCHFNGAFCNSLHCDELVPMCRMPYQLENGYCVEDNTDYGILGATGCGLCALFSMRAAGIEYLKIVGRGGYSKDMIRDINAVRRALDILDGCSDENEYKEKMLQQLFDNHCSNNCYY